MEYAPARTANAGVLVAQSDEPRQPSRDAPRSRILYGDGPVCRGGVRAVRSHGEEQASHPGVRRPRSCEALPSKEPADNLRDRFAAGGLKPPPTQTRPSSRVVQMQRSGDCSPSHMTGYCPSRRLNSPSRSGWVGKRKSRGESRLERLAPRVRRPHVSKRCKRSALSRRALFS